MPITQSELDEVALSRAEYEAIADRLGRDPSDLELGLFGSLWSEHCGYKHSKPLLRTLPGESERLLVSLGTENAGVVDIGDGLAIAMKIESHNHPSAIEPHEGAATGVGGIVRDIFAMGARPIALLNSLRFGKPDTARNRYLLSGVVGGISFYGNCLGIPNVGGEVVFASCYDGNPLVNAMCVGLVEDGRIMSARAEEPGDVLLLVGSDTGRDGIHGASGLASRTFEEQNELRSAVQVGNPFLEKVLIEACMEVIQLDSVVGLQDCGAAGITSGAIEMAERSDMGLRLDVAEVPRREEGMTPYEVMLSESQERMLLAVKPGREHEVQAIFSKWDLHATAIGEFFEGDSVVIQDGEDVLSETRIKVLTDPP
ncbi:MAG: phosphoribosylformylglycinamidine synthase II, partial [Chloroflexi bacterium]|nr:phosphoribosylformylglycinamidine synthase II [Chloroflexota bacterium]